MNPWNLIADLAIAAYCSYLYWRTARLTAYAESLNTALIELQDLVFDLEDAVFLPEGEDEPTAPVVDITNEAELIEDAKVVP